VKAYLLGVPDRYRGEPLESDLARLGIPHEIVLGVDGASWSADELARVYSRRAAHVVSRRQLSPAEVACVLGHRQMMSAFVTSGDEWALFLEDDVRIDQSLLPVFASAKSMSKGPVVVQIYAQVPPRSRSLGHVGSAGAEIWRQSAPAYGAAAYLMNRSAAEIALRAYRRRRVDSVADWPFCWAQKVNFWQTEFGYVSHPQVGVDSLLQDARLDSRLKARTHPRVPGVTGHLLKMLGVRALYGRVSNVPFRALYRRDFAEGRAALRLAPSSVPRADARGE
jgi:hypothetical protein